MAGKKGGNTGKNKKSDNVLHREGTFRKDRHGDLDRKISFDNELTRVAPEWLDNHGQEVWRRVTTWFSGKDVLYENSYYTLAQFCALAGELVAKKGKVNAAHHTAMRLLGQKFGMDPVSQGLLQAPPNAEGKSRFELD